MFGHRVAELARNLS